MAEFLLALPHILEHEGGSAFTNDPTDPGGATRWGVSLRYLLARGDLDGNGLPDGDVDGDGDVDVDDVRAMPRDRAAWIYESGFWVPNRCGEIVAQRVADKIVDTAVNVGGAQCWRLAQRAVNDLLIFNADFGRPKTLDVDGKVGRATLDYVNSLPEVSYLRQFAQHQLAFYEQLIVARPKLVKYRNGWARRARWPLTE